jgi:LuxR family maltose regulon positive regulatory protein
MVEQAFDHAVAAGDVDLVIAICQHHVPAKINRGEFTVVRRWLGSLPEAWYAAHPALTLARAGLLGVTGEFEAFARHLEEVESRLMGVESDEAHRLRARVTAFRCAAACMQNDLAQAEEFGRRAGRELPEDDVFFRELMNLALGDSYRQVGRWHEASEHYLEALRISQGGSVHALGALADLNLRQGLLGHAADLWERALRIIEGEESWGRLPLPAIGWAFIRMAEIAYERDERERARDLLARGLDRAELGGDVRGMIAGRLLAGRIDLTEGEAESAAAHLERARPLVEQAQFLDWTSRFERFQLELWLAQDRLRAAVQWCDRMEQEGSLDARPESEIAQLAVARVLIVKGDPPSLERARKLLRRLLEAAEAEGRAGVAIEALALQALSAWKLGDRAGALASLERSLRSAEPEGYVRLFADLGLPMGRLLQEARSRSLMAEYADKLLAAFQSGLPGSTPAIEAIPEPLTPREQEVLELIASGLTNREIAAKLVISSETVKKHTANIFGKLRVRNRTQAVARGRELDLLA